MGVLDISRLALTPLQPGNPNRLGTLSYYHQVKDGVPGVFLCNSWGWHVGVTRRWKLVYWTAVNHLDKRC